MMKKLVFSLLFVVCGVLLVSGVYAWAVGSYYWDEENALYMQPGEKRVVSLYLQNVHPGDSEDIVLRARPFGSEGIYEVQENSLDYYVPYGAKDLTVNFLVSVPSDAPSGKVYTVGASFKEAPRERGGTLSFSTEVLKNVFIVVGENPNVYLSPLPTIKPSPAKGIVGSVVFTLMIMTFAFALIYNFVLKKKYN